MPLVQNFKALFCQGGSSADKVVTEGDLYAVLRGDEELNELTKHVLKPNWKH